MKKFVINLERCLERMDNFDDTYSRWVANDCLDLDDNDDILKRMISMHNINPYEHKAKCACLLSHTNLWKYIVENKLNDILIVEDDAEQINHFPDFSDVNDFTYVGGFLTKKMTDGAVKVDSFDDGFNDIPVDHKFLTTLSYYIPTWEIAEQLIVDITSQKRFRAIDVMLNKVSIKRNLYYPALFIERDLQSQIRPTKTKHPTELYTFERKKDIIKYVIPSYQRYSKCKSLTLTYLEKHHIPKKDIFIFVRPDDKDIFKYRTLLLEGYNVIEYNVRGIGATHNMITQHFKSGQFICECDDDIIDMIDNQRRSVLSLDTMVRKMIKKMTEEGINYAGTYQCDNIMFMSQNKEFTYDLRYMLGLFRIRRICKDIKIKSNFAEDFENCCAHYQRDSKILKMNWIAGKTKNYADGGCDGSGRNIASELRDKKLVQSLYPDYCTLFQRKNKRWDLRLRDKS
tara:strand:+ start:5328 stop:6695 length:1368 start_codon:yes stop_codon:yes gene_type:complete